MPINATDYLRDLATRIRKVPVCHGVDGYDIDILREVSQEIAELEKANVDYVDANTGLIREVARLREALSAILGYDRNFYDNGRPGYEKIARDALNGGAS